MATKSRRTLAADRAAGLATIPAEALRFDAGPFRFAAGNGGDGKSADRPITMLARTAQPIDHWYWGQVVHDMAGMSLAAPSLPIDYCHDSEEVLGYLDQFQTGPDGLTVSGQLVSFQPDDRTAEVCHKADAGVPYQSSIYFDPNSVVCEDVPAGMQAQVNGYAFEGPGLILRKWKLMAVSVCPYGADSGTRTKLAAGDGEHTVQFVSRKELPPMEVKPAADSTLTADNANNADASKLSAPPPPAPAVPADPRAEFKATLAKFTAAFGAANGAAWAAEGLSYEAALEKHAGELAASNKTLAAEKAALETKLSAVPRGEKDAVSFSTNEKHDSGKPATGGASGKFAGLGKLGAFAENLKLPGQAK